MDTVADKQVGWNSRDAWRCLLAIILSAFIVNVWLRIGVRSSPGIFAVVGDAFGLAFSVVNSEWAVALFCLVVFTRYIRREFLIHAGLKQGFGFFGWCAAGWPLASPSLTVTELPEAGPLQAGSLIPSVTIFSDALGGSLR